MTLVISPLISLMKDQVAALEQSQIPAAGINSSLSLAEYDEVYRRAEQGAYKLLYVAPERLGTEDFLAFVRGVQVSFVAVDEAHCVSQWGQDFRPSYLGIADFVSQLPERPVLGAFTATATEQVKDDIHKMLGLIDPLRLTTGFDRPNLYFEVMHPKNRGGGAALLSLRAPGADRHRLLRHPQGGRLGLRQTAGAGICRHPLPRGAGRRGAQAQPGGL